jgi:hypothetical protein
LHGHRSFHRADAADRETRSGIDQLVTSRVALCAPLMATLSVCQEPDRASRWPITATKGTRLPAILTTGSPSLPNLLCRRKSAGIEREAALAKGKAAQTEMIANLRE